MKCKKAKRYNAKYSNRWLKVSFHVRQNIVRPYFKIFIKSLPELGE
jgi:hypothetical protein